MSDTPPSDPKDKPASGSPPEPFVRGRIVWGRPPETVFRTGPLPRAPQSWSQSPLRPATPSPRPAGNIFTDSLIPRAAPAADPDILPGEKPLVDETPAAPVAPAAPVEPVTARPPRARKAKPAPAPEPTPKPAEAPVVEAYAEPEPRVEPAAEPVLETLVEAEPIQPTAPPRSAVEIIVEPEPAEPIQTVPPPLSGAADTGSADPRAMPSVVVTPTLYARVEAVVEKVSRKDRWLVAAAIGATVVTGGFIWLATLPSEGTPPLDMDAPPPAASGTEPTVPVEAEPAPAAEASAAEPSAPVATGEPEAPTARAEPTAPPAPVRVQPARPTVQPAPPVAQQPPPPVIEPAPLVVEPPTAATPPPTDPDAPIETRPQPLN